MLTCQAILPVTSDRLVNVAELTPYVEDKPAPEPLVALQAFANTLDVETDTDAAELAGRVQALACRRAGSRPGESPISVG